MVKQVFKLHSSDNVFVALANLPLGTELEVDGVILTENVQRGHAAFEFQSKWSETVKPMLQNFRP